MIQSIYKGQLDHHGTDKEKDCYKHTETHIHNDDDNHHGHGTHYRHSIHNLFSALGGHGKHHGRHHHVYDPCGNSSYISSLFQPDHRKTPDHDNEKDNSHSQVDILYKERSTFDK